MKLHSERMPCAGNGSLSNPPLLNQGWLIPHFKTQRDQYFKYPQIMWGYLKSKHLPTQSKGGGGNFLLLGKIESNKIFKVRSLHPHHNENLAGLSINIDNQ